MQPDILIVSDRPRFAAGLRRALETGHLPARVVRFQALGEDAAATPDLALIDFRSDAAPALARRLSMSVCVAFGLDDGAAAIAALRAGVEDYTDWPVETPLRLHARLRGALRTRAEEEEARRRRDTGREIGLAPQTEIVTRGVALIVGRPPAAVAAALRREASGLGLEVAVAPDPAGALTAAGAAPPCIAFVWQESETAAETAALAGALSAAGPGRACGVLAALRNPGDDHPDPMAVETAPVGATPAEMAIRFRKLARQWRQRERMNEMFAAGILLAATDPLTGLHNRRYADSHVARQFALAKETGEPLSLLMVDIDRFKTVNDRYGHDTGDEVLTALARRLTQNVRGGDLVARIGGEEFLIVMRDVGAAKARQAAERLRRAVSATPLALSAGGRAHLTVSVGVASLSAADRDPSSLRRRADRALLAAKALGRNRVTVRDDRSIRSGLGLADIPGARRAAGSTAPPAPHAPRR